MDLISGTIPFTLLGGNKDGRMEIYLIELKKRNPLSTGKPNHCKWELYYYYREKLVI